MSLSLSPLAPFLPLPPPLPLPSLLAVNLFIDRSTENKSNHILPENNFPETENLERKRRIQEIHFSLYPSNFLRCNKRKLMNRRLWQIIFFIKSFSKFVSKTFLTEHKMSLAHLAKVKQLHLFSLVFYFSSPVLAQIWLIYWYCNVCIWYAMLS